MRIMSHLPLEAVAGVAEQVEGLEFVHVPQRGEPPEDAHGEVLLTFAWGSPNLAQLVARGVRWVHTIGTGVDRFPLHAVGDCVLTCSRGASALPIAEWTLAVMLAYEKRLPESWVSAPPERWNSADLGGLSGRTLGLVGLGGIGSAVATRALAFDMRVRALRRTRRPSPLPDVEIVTRLDELVADADHLVLAVPATERTRHLLDAAAFARVKPGVHLVNIARGSLIDQDALRDALDSGRVARASLDVADPEPLPEGHWLYAHPQVRLSPHISWCMPGAVDRLLDTFVENLRHRAAGRELVGRVDVKEGY